MDTESVAAWIDERAEDHRFSGVALVWRDGEPVFAHAAGLAHRGLGVPVHVGTRFAVASMAKMVTAATALRLVDRGELDLHRPLVETLPREWQPVGLTPAHTLHHLLSHTSGLGNYHDHDANTWESFTSCWDRVPTYRARGPADMLPLFINAPAVAPPGAEYRYTDANFILAGLVIEAVTGRSFSACAADEVFVPAGMADSAFAQLDDEPPGLAVGYLVTDGPPDTWRSNIYSLPAGGMPDGGLITTATDLARLIDALEAGALLSPTLHAAMTSPQGPNKDDLERYGYGCELVVVDGAVTMIGHGGHDPGVSGLLTHYRDRATTTVVLCNHDRGSWAVCQHLAEALGLDDPRP
jgi:CubicO group peptidase (beta-lactamase class C family)